MAFFAKPPNFATDGRKSFNTGFKQPWQWGLVTTQRIVMFWFVRCLFVLQFIPVAHFVIVIFCSCLRLL